MFLNFIIVFLIVLFKFLIATLICSTNSIFIYLLIIVIFILSFIKFLGFRKISKFVVFRLCLLFMIGFLSFIKMSSLNLLFPILIAIVYYDREKKIEDIIKHLIKSFFISMLLLFIITVLLNLLDFLPSYNLIRIKENNIDIRYSLGFSHPAFVGLYFTFILFGYLYLYGEKKLSYILGFIFSLLIYYLSDSRIALYVCILYLLLCILKNKKIFKKLIRITPYMFLILTIITIVSTYLFEAFDLKVLDTFFSGRLNIYYNFINNMKILTVPFGSDFGDVVLDNYYLSIFYYFGFIGYILYLTFYIYTTKFLNDKLLCIQLCLLIYGLADTNVMVTNINFVFSIQILYMFYNMKKKLRGDV